jgi:hypothetical protein
MVFLSKCPAPGTHTRIDLANYLVCLFLCEVDCFCVNVCCTCVSVFSVPLSTSNVRFIARRRQRIWAPVLSMLARALPGSDYPLRLLQGAMSHLTGSLPDSNARDANRENATQWRMALWTAWAHSWLAQLDAQLAQLHPLTTATFTLPGVIVDSADDNTWALNIWQVDTADSLTLHSIFVALHGHLSALLKGPSAWYGKCVPNSWSQRGSRFYFSLLMFFVCLSHINTHTNTHTHTHTHTAIFRCTGACVCAHPC